MSEIAGLAARSRAFGEVGEVAIQPVSVVPSHSQIGCRIRVRGVQSADDYLRLIGYLDGMSIVKRIEPVQAMPGELELDLELATGLRNFSRFVDRAGVLSSISGSDSTEDDDGGASAPAPRTATFRLGG